MDCEGCEYDIIDESPSDILKTIEYFSKKEISTTNS